MEKNSTREIITPGVIVLFSRGFLDRMETSWEDGRKTPLAQSGVESALLKDNIPET